MHEIGIEDNILEYDLAFSKTLLGKACQRCNKAFVYKKFDKDSSSKDGYSNTCPKCKTVPRLSTEENYHRYREMNENSAATEAQRRPDEIHYLERDSVGRALTHTEFVRKLEKLLSGKLVVGDAYFLNEFSLYVVDNKQIETNGVRYIGYIPTGRIQEFSSYNYNKYGVPIDEYARGYRGILMKLIMERYVSEQDVEKEFGPTTELIWCKTLYNWRNQKN